MVTVFTESIQTAAQQLTRSKLSATCKLSAEVGPYFPQRSPQASSSSSLLSHQWSPKLRTQTPRVISIQAWGTGTRSCSALVTSILSGLFTTGKAGAPNVNKAEFDKFLMGKSLDRIKDVYGFYKYSLRDPKRNPKGGYLTIKGLRVRSNSDKWLDLWNHVDSGGNNYIYSDNRKALGTKCIVGYCYLHKPVWVMVR